MTFFRGVIAVFALLSLGSMASAQSIVSFKLVGTPQEHGFSLGPSAPVVSGSWTLTSLTPTSSGGTANAVYHVTSGLGPGNAPCAGKNQNVKFTWIFNRDPTLISTSEPLGIELAVQADSGACAPMNPTIATTPQGYFVQSPALSEAKNSVFAQPPAGYTNQVERSIEASTQLNPGGFSVLLGGGSGGAGALQIRLDYNYQNVPTAPLQPPAGGKPGCTSTSWVVSPMSGATLYELQISAGGAACADTITTKLTQASVQIVTPPSHGTLTQTGTLSLVYKPAPGFHGTDHYVFHYCGSSGVGSGCATINYTVQVQ